MAAYEMFLFAFSSVTSYTGPGSLFPNTILYASKHAGRAQHSFFRLEMRDAGLSPEISGVIPAAVAPRKGTAGDAENRRKDRPI